MWCIKYDNDYISRTLGITEFPELALKFYSSRDAAQAMSILENIYANLSIQKLKYVEA